MNTTLTAMIFNCYPVLAIGYFLKHCLNFSFFRTTVLYYIFDTFFVYLIVYGSPYSLVHAGIWINAGYFPMLSHEIHETILNSSALSKDASTFFFWVAGFISFYVTFPQSVAHSYQTHLKSTASPTEIIGNAVGLYQVVRLGMSFLFSIGLAAIGDIFILGEWIFLIFALISLLAPYPHHNVILMLIGCYATMALAGNSIASGIPNSPFKFIAKMFVPDIGNIMRRWIVGTIKTIFLVIYCILLMIIGSSTYSWVQPYNHNNKSLVDIIITIVHIVAALGVMVILAVTFKWLFNKILSLINKLLQWMGFEPIIMALDRETTS